MSKFSLFAQILLTVLFLIGFFWMLREVMSGTVLIPADLKDAFLTLLGVVTGSVLTIVNFWFSSSRSSQAKDERS